MSAIGKVLRAETRSFVFGCRVERQAVPIFGSLVRTRIQYRDATVYGLIYNIAIEDDGMTKMLSVAEDVREEDIAWQRARRVPVEASVLCVGYEEAGGEPRYALSAQPPITLDEVNTCDSAEIERFTAHVDWLRLVLDSRDVPTEELLAAAIRIARESRANPTAQAMFTQACGRELARWLASDARRLESVLRRL
ncbi:MAG: hypothetical protein NTZ50_03840 [Chloroflexi bacterium]|nr:hypothetical protein [Chloroflexota bacterium]